jgi:hypothetical protein
MCGGATGMPAASSPPHPHLMHHCAGASHGFAASLMSGERLIMLLGHIAAAVVVGLWLVAGERALLTLLAVTAQSVVEAWRAMTEAARGRVGAAAVLSRPRLQPGSAARCPIRMSMWDRVVVPRRGPPGSASPEPCAYAV